MDTDGATTDTGGTKETVGGPTRLPHPPARRVAGAAQTAVGGSSWQAYQAAFFSISLEAPVTPN